MLEIDGYNLARAEHPSNVKGGRDWIWSKRFLPV